jgi:hypothetical protein
VSLRLVSADEIIRSYGPSPNSNPYLSPSSLVLGKPNEFVVMEVRFRAGMMGKAHFDAVLATAGTTDAVLMTKEAMVDFWTLWQNGEQNMSRRFAIIESSYMRSQDFSLVNAPRFWAVIRGKNPLPRPAEIKATISIDGKEPFSISIPLPEEPKK